MTDKPLTLSEMAKHYTVSPKTFSKYVRQYKIPFAALGRSKRFDPDVVRSILRTVTPADAVVKQMPVVAKSTAKKSKFAEAVGL